MPVHRINVTTVSWISKPPLAQYSNVPKWQLLTSDGWLYSIAYGLYHSGNSEPPQEFASSDYRGQETLARQFRAFSTCTVGLKTDQAGKFESMTSYDPVVAPKAGDTPPFDSPKMLRVGGVVQEIARNLPLYHDIVSEGTRFSPGEASSLSKVSQPAVGIWRKDGVPAIPYGSIKPPAGELVLAHSLVKFRAGSNGDRIGCLAFRAPNHVPWVWCEALLTYAGGELTLYGAGSGFPSHAFYMGGRQRGLIQEATSINDLKKVFTSGLAAQISWKNLRPDQVNAQAPIQETDTGASIGVQPYTAPAINSVGSMKLPLRMLTPAAN